LPNRLNELPRDADIVFYCQTGGRSARALDVARDAGFTRAKHLRGGYVGLSS
jgi:adenylyltransferase/sulfurtransferase